MRAARYAALGLVLGLLWGVSGRIWMRLISTDPTFTWSGTLLLVGMAAVAGLLLGLVHATRVRGGTGWSRLLFLPVLVLFAGQGLVMLPAVVLGGWGLRRGVVGRLVAVAAVLSAPAILLVESWEEIDAWPSPYPPMVYRGVIAGGALVLGAAAAWGASAALRPWRPGRVSEPTGSTEPMRIRIG